MYLLVINKISVQALLNSLHNNRTEMFMNMYIIMKVCYLSCLTDNYLQYMQDYYSVHEIKKK